MSKINASDLFYDSSNTWELSEKNSFAKKNVFSQEVITSAVREDVYLDTFSRILGFVLFLTIIAFCLVAFVRLYFFIKKSNTLRFSFYFLLILLFVLVGAWFWLYYYRYGFA